VPARVAIRRLQLRGLAPRDHPAPGDLEQRLRDAARSFLTEALEQAVGTWSGDAVLRIHRLDVDISLETTFEPKAFAALLAGAIAAGLHQAEERAPVGSVSEGIVYFPTRAAYLAAMLEALAERRAAQSWWLSDADGLRFLSPASAIRTAVLADTAVGFEALVSLAPLRLATVLRALGPGEADRILDGLAAVAAGTTSAEGCVAAITMAARELQTAPSPLALYLRAATLRPGITGPMLAASARIWIETEQSLDPASAAATAGSLTRTGRDSAAVGFPRVPGKADRNPEGSAARLPETAHRALADALARHHGAASSNAEPTYVFTQFGGLLLLVSGLGMAEISAVVVEWPNTAPETARLIGYAALGVCAGRLRFAHWLRDPLWRELFGLDLQGSGAAVTARLGALSAEEWATLAPLGTPVEHQRDARFLLAPRTLAGSRAATHTLAALARACSLRFARRLIGFSGASAPFLWANLLGVNAVLERREGGWSAQLSRPPLDVELSLSRIAEDSVRMPSGIRIEISRTAA
jgi:hypothetical protein